MILCPHCGNGSDSCECRLVTRRRFFAGFGLALGGTLLAPKLVMSTLTAPSASPAIIVPTQDMARLMAEVYSKFRVNAFPVLSPLLSTIRRDAKPRSLFDPPPSQGVYWDVNLNATHMPRIVRDYRCPRGSFAAFERFVERQYGQA